MSGMLQEVHKGLRESELTWSKLDGNVLTIDLSGDCDGELNEDKFPTTIEDGKIVLNVNKPCNGHGGKFRFQTPEEFLEFLEVLIGEGWDGVDWEDVEEADEDDDE